MSKKRNEFSLNIGTSSLLYIFVILCLVSFAILSLSSSIGDKKLSNRVLENTNAYYDACDKAEELIASFDSTLHDLYSTGISRSGYFEKVGHTKSFSVQINEVQTLCVELKILFPVKAGEPFYEIEKYRTEMNGNLEYDDSLPVFK